jgi:hypothetical protein
VVRTNETESLGNLSHTGGCSESLSIENPTSQQNGAIQLENVRDDAVSEHSEGIENITTSESTPFNRIESSNSNKGTSTLRDDLRSWLMDNSVPLSAFSSLFKILFSYLPSKYVATSFSLSEFLATRLFLSKCPKLTCSGMVISGIFQDYIFT